MSAAPSIAFTPWREGAIRIEPIGEDGREVRVLVVRDSRWLQVYRGALVAVVTVWPADINKVIAGSR